MKNVRELGSNRTQTDTAIKSSPLEHVFISNDNCEVMAMGPFGEGCLKAG